MTTPSSSGRLATHNFYLLMPHEESNYHTSARYITELIAQSAGINMNDPILLWFKHSGDPPLAGTFRLTDWKGKVIALNDDLYGEGTDAHTLIETICHYLTHFEHSDHDSIEFKYRWKDIKELGMEAMEADFEGRTPQ